jgi:hypothetical protein
MQSGSLVQYLVFVCKVFEAEAWMESPLQVSGSEAGHIVVEVARS